MVIINEGTTSIFEIEEVEIGMCQNGDSSCGIGD